MKIHDELTIDPRELSFAASRSGGPGGQNVNKVNSRITLRFDVENSPSLSPEQKARLRERLGGRISKDGILQLHAEEHRVQGRNREAATQRFVEIVREALAKTLERRPTRTPRRVVEKRLERKRQTAQKKRRRSVRIDPDRE